MFWEGHFNCHRRWYLKKHFEWECKLVQPLWRRVGRFLENYKENYHMSQQSHTWAYTQRKTVKTHVPQCSLQHYLQQPGRGSSLNVHQQKNGQRRCGTYNGILVIKRNRIVSSAEMWMDPETVIQTKVNQREKQISYLNEESRKMIKVLFAKQKQRHIHKEQRYGY